MGSKLSRAVHGYTSRNERRVLLVGLDGAGKSTILKHVRELIGAEGKSKLGSTKADFDVETIEHDKFVLHIWDVRGQEKMRPYWRHYYTGTQGVVFVVDATDVARLPIAIAELRNLAIDDQLSDAAIIVLANKSDKSGALTADEISAAMDLEQTLAGHEWSVQSTVATKGIGISETFSFLTKSMKAF